MRLGQQIPAWLRSGLAALPDRLPLFAPRAPEPGSGMSLLGGWPERLRDYLAAEQERWFPVAVVAMTGGIGLYYALPREPGFMALSASFALGCAAAALAARTQGAAWRFVLILVLSGAFGFAIAKVRTLTISAPVIEREFGPVGVDGRIESVSVLAPKRARIVLLPTRIGKQTDHLPLRLRLSISGEKTMAGLAPGQWVSAYARLLPPPEPAQPGGYDFARWAFFEGIGGVGFTLGAPKQLGPAHEVTLIERFNTAMEQMRAQMTTRIQTVLPNDDGAISAALITGERTAIADDDVQAFRDSGLQHVLSISGLHMALAGFGIFWLIRASLALWPLVALTQPIKKWAAVAALGGATFYLFLSGASAPAVRSYIMLSCMLFAVLADRPALSMRAVALAALFILLVAPENVVEPSFEMSFAAIVALIALAEWQRERKRADPTDIGWLTRGVKYLWRYAAGVVLTSLVAGLATTPFAIFHFDRAAGYSLLSNLLALPIVGCIIMPAAAIAVVLMPFGFDAWPLKVMGWGVHLMTAIARWVAALPGAVALVRAWPVGAMIAIVFGGLWLCLWQKSWRWAGLGPIAAGFLVIAFATPPDILLARDGTSAAIRGKAGHFVLLGNRLDEYTAEQWLLRDGDARAVDEARKDSVCDENGCVGKTGSGATVSLALRLAALVDDCERADILLAAIPVRRDCARPRQIIYRFAVARNGAMAIYLDGQDMRTETVAAWRGVRPWTGPPPKPAQ